MILKYLLISPRPLSGRSRVKVSYKMFKVFVLLCLTVLCYGEIINIRSSPINLNEEHALFINEIKASQWRDHILDFLKLVDLEKVVNTAIRFINDLEVIRFIEFLRSPKFKDMVWDLENMKEFKEVNYSF